MAKEATAVQGKAQYVIEPAWFEQHKRSLPAVLAGRMCYQCKTRLEDNPETTIEDLLDSIRECCAKGEAFLESGLPLQEAVFRLLLKEGNRPMDAEAITAKIREWLMINRDTRLVTQDVIERILQNDRFYGFRRIAPEGEAEPAA